MLSKAAYTPYDMEYTILMDFSLDDLAGVMDVKQKYSGKGSYFDAVDTYQDAYESVFTTMDRDFCTRGLQLDSVRPGPTTALCLG